MARNSSPAKIQPPPVFYPASSIPIPGGCLFCGIGHQWASAVMVAQHGLENVARDLWTAKRTGTQQLGGRPSAQWLAGYLCRTCADAVEHVHAMGPTALERALVAALVPSGIPKLDWDQVDGLIGWGALVAHAGRPIHPSQTRGRTPDRGST